MSATVRRRSSLLWSLTGLGALALLATTLAWANDSKASTRPIRDFVASQGTWNWPMGDDPDFLFVPPIRNFVGWSDIKGGYAASLDYAGLANAWIEAESGGAVSFGTQTSGMIVERPLADGRVEVHVVLHTRNALMWAIPCAPDGTADFGGGPLQFGCRATNVLEDGAEPALGSCTLELKFINTAPGAALPDLCQLAFAAEEGQELTFICMGAQGDGTLANGKPGRIQVTQTGLFMTAWKGATADGFPAEHIRLRDVGGGK